jgi:hypothetical protein
MGVRRLRSRRARAAVAVVAAAMALLAPETAFALGFGAAPALPTLTTVKLNATAQTTTTTATGFSVKEATGEKSGWNTTVAGQSGSGKSAVFAQYCPEAAGCSGDALGYVAGGRTLPAGSLILSSTGASFSGGTGTAPTLLCGSGCAVDAAKAEKIASYAAGGAGAATWTASGFAAASLKLATPSTVRVLKAAEVYRVNILWTLSTGP